MKSIKKRVVLYLALFPILVLLIVTGVLFVTAETPTPSVSIERFNLTFDNNVYIKYAVKINGVENVNTDHFKLLVWTTPQTSWKKGSEDAAVATIGTQTIDGEEYYIFAYKDIAAKEMTDDIYACAYYEADGHFYYSSVEKYSILQYAYNKLGITGTASTNENLKTMLRNMLEYGASAQKYFNYRIDRLANDDFRKITVEGGVLSDGTTTGLYFVGERINLVAPETDKKGQEFSHWETSDGIKIGTKAVFSTVVGTGIVGYRACYILPPEELEYVSNGDGTCNVTGIGTYRNTNLRIPSLSPTGERVTGIAAEAFSECNNITSVFISDSVKTIGAGAFSNCNCLTSVTIPNSITMVGSYAFGGCLNLNAVYITDIEVWCNISFGDYTANPLYYAGNLYLNNELLTDLIIPESVTSIGDYAFYHCSELKSVTIPNRLTTIGTGAFNSCVRLKTVTINYESKLTTIRASAFCNCIGLTSVAIPSGVTDIGNYAFYGCIKLVEVWNYSTLSIKSGEFYSNGFVGDYALVVHTSPDETGHIHKDADDYIFYENGDIVYLMGYIGTKTELILPEQYNNKSYSIYNHAFANSDKITSITISNGVTSIDYSAFMNCYKLVEIWNYSSLDITAGNSSHGDVGYYALIIHTSPKEESNVYTTDEGYRFYQNGETVYLLEYVGTKTTLELPANYNGIAYGIYEWAFVDCDNLTDIIIPTGITSIGSYAFAYCNSLTNVMISNGITSIGDKAFYGCGRLIEINIPDGVNSIGANAFGDCVSLTNISIPNSVTSIGAYAFQYCSNLTIYVEAASQPISWDTNWNYSNRPVEWGYQP